MTHKFGWCLTRHHASCIASLTYYEREYKCACSCHTTDNLGTDNSVSQDPPTTKPTATKEAK